MNVLNRSLVRSTLLASVASVIAVPAATAATVLYTDQATFETDAASLGNSQMYVETFEENTIGFAYAFLSPPLMSGVANTDFPTGLDAPDLSVDALDSGLFALIPYGGWPHIPSTAVGANSEPGTVVMNFAGDGVMAVGFDLYGIDTFTTNIPDTFDYVIRDMSGAELTSGQLAISGAGDASGAFVGVVSTTAVGSVEVSGSRFGLATQEYVDDIQSWGPSNDPCEGDLDGDSNVGFTDLNQVLAAWGSCAGCPEDVDGDGNVGFTDLNLVLAGWGPCS